ncbi:MAG: hypothetical protein JNJ42_11315 [Burkholderiaceae bacterium]|jgi:TRAP-type C4-dicarboxylate transport system permease large subunit|nr:hypothetical protein [Burkholderiaceae bacterium]
MIEIGLLTPPIGMHVLVIKTTVGDEVGVRTVACRQTAPLRHSAPRPRR